MSKTDHLARAKDYIAKGEDYYRRAADEIVAARKADPTLGYREIAKRVGRSAEWCRELVNWRTSDNDHAPFGGPRQDRAQTKSRTLKAAREEPEVIAEAIAKAPPEQQRKIADAIIKQPAVESSVKKLAEGPRHQSRTPQSPEVKLGNATFLLWEVGELLMDNVPSSEERVRMNALADKAQRLATGIAQLLDTGELEDAFRELVEEVGTEA